MEMKGTKWENKNNQRRTNRKKCEKEKNKE